MVGRTLGHCRILSRLGAGGMGEVFLAEDTRLGRKVAIKLLPPESVTDEQAKKRLVREAQAAAKLDHPNICAIHEISEEDGHTFIVMQYVEGETLASRIQNKPLDLKEAIDVGVQVADALAEAHSQGITHRDIKPQNIMITAKKQVKVLDFGLAKLVRDRQFSTSEAATESLLTGPGMLVGTVPYMSPEQLKGEAIDARSDIFSFGAVLYEMVSGRQPFVAESAAGTLSAILTQEPPPLARYATNVPEELQRIVRKCLEKDREQRYQSTRDLLVDLATLKKNTDSGTVAVSSPVSQRRRTRHKWLYFTVALAILLVSAIALYLLSREGQPANSAIHSLAVLPFVNASGDPNAEYLGDGITESLINSFSQLPQLKVVARTTAFRYKGKDTDTQIIGRDLRVDAIITGRVTQQGDTLIVQADLLSTGDGSQVWGARYSRRVSDIFTVQEQIAKEISEKLRLRLTSEEKQGLSKRYTGNIKAYQNYLLGRSLAQRRTPQDLLVAISYYEKAIEEDKNYALAYVGLTDAYAVLVALGNIAPDEGRRKAEEAASKAVSLDPNLAEAHVAIGQTHIFFAPFNFSLGESELRLAIELSPSLADAHRLLGASLLAQGHLNEGLEMLLKARELDLLSPLISRMVAYGYLLKRDYRRALELHQQASELGPTFVIYPDVEIYISSGALTEALAELEKAKRERRDEPTLIQGLGMVYAALGRREEALQIIKELEQMSGRSLNSAHMIARIYAVLNEKELALAWLKRGFEAGAIPIFYKDAPIWDPIRSNPRFQDLLRRMGIPL